MDQETEQVNCSKQHNYCSKHKWSFLQADYSKEASH